MQDIGGGQFGQALGGVDALKAAMQRRGMDSSILDQVSASAPSGPSNVAPPIPEGTQNIASSIPQTLTTPATPEPQQQFRSAEQEIALKALANTVKTENKIAEGVLGLR